MIATAPNRSCFSTSHSEQPSPRANLLAGAAAAAPPPLLIGGTETQPGFAKQDTASGRLVTLDWIRCTLDRHRLDDVLRLLESVFQVESFTHKRGMWFFKHRLVADGVPVMVLFDALSPEEARDCWEPVMSRDEYHSSANGEIPYLTLDDDVESDDDVKPYICVDVAGSALAGLTVAARFALLMQFCDWSAKFTRLDVAIDERGGMAFDLIGLMADSVEAGELCVLRKSSRVISRAREEVSGDTLYLGSRESPVFVRVYDKGLEMGNATMGQHVRFEVEYKDSHAHAFAYSLAHSRPVDESGDRCEHDTVTVCKLAHDLALSSVDFRENNGRSELSRRPRVGWWEEFRAGADDLSLDVPPRGESTLDSYVKWMCEAVIPTLIRIKHQTGQSVDDLCRAMIERAELPAPAEFIVSQRVYDWLHRDDPVDEVIPI